jgi:hypothetical protein
MSIDMEVEPPSWRERGLAVLQAGLIVLAFVLCVCGLRPYKGLLLVTALPAIRLLREPAYRRRLAAVFDLGLARRVLRADEALPWRLAVLGVVLPSGFLFLLTGWCACGSGDTWPVAPAALELIRAGDLDLTDFTSSAPASILDRTRGLPYPVERRGGGIYSSYQAGMVPFTIPTALAARLGRMDSLAPQTLSRVEKWTAVWVSAAVLGLFFLLARHVAALPAALLTTLALATGSAVLTTCSQGLFQHGGVMFWMLLALLIEFRRPPEPSWRCDAVQGLACAGMLACRMSAGLLVAALGAWVLCRSPLRAVRLTLATVLAAAPLFLLHLTLYGTPLGPSAFYFGAPWDWTFQGGLAGVLVAPSHGLLVYQPWLLLAPLGWLLEARRGEPLPGPRGWPWFCLTAAVLHVLLVAAWSCWWGGHSYGSRLTSDVLPALALLTVPAVVVLLRTRTGRALVAATLLVSAVLHLPQAFRHLSWHVTANVDRHPERLWSWSHAPFLGKPHFPEE